MPPKPPSHETATLLNPPSTDQKKEESKNVLTMLALEQNNIFVHVKAKTIDELSDYGWNSDLAAALAEALLNFDAVIPPEKDHLFSENQRRKIDEDHSLAYIGANVENGADLIYFLSMNEEDIKQCNSDFEFAIKIYGEARSITAGDPERVVEDLARLAFERTASGTKICKNKSTNRWNRRINEMRYEIERKWNAKRVAKIVGSPPPGAPSLTTPKLDAFLALPSHDAHLDHGFHLMECLDNFSVPVLRQLENDGLLSNPCTVVKSNLSKNYPCFPYAVVELKKPSASIAEELTGYNQTANGIAVCLSLLAKLYDDRTRTDAEIGLPVVGFTFIGASVKIWVAHASRGAVNLLYRHIHCILDLYLTDLWDAVRFVRVLEQLRFWAVHFYKPLVSDYISQWRYRSTKTPSKEAVPVSVPSHSIHDKNDNDNDDDDDDESDAESTSEGAESGSSSPNTMSAESALHRPLKRSLSQASLNPIQSPGSSKNERSKDLFGTKTLKSFQFSDNMEGYSFYNPEFTVPKSVESRLPSDSAQASRFVQLHESTEDFPKDGLSQSPKGPETASQGQEELQMASSSRDENLKPAQHQSEVIQRMPKAPKDHDSPLVSGNSPDTAFAARRLAFGQTKWVQQSPKTGRWKSASVGKSSPRSGDGSEFLSDVSIQHQKPDRSETVSGFSSAEFVRSDVESVDQIPRPVKTDLLPTQTAVEEGREFNLREMKDALPLLGTISGRTSRDYTDDNMQDVGRGGEDDSGTEYQSHKDPEVYPHSDDCARECESDELKIIQTTTSVEPNEDLPYVSDSEWTDTENSDLDSEDRESDLDWIPGASNAAWRDRNYSVAEELEKELLELEEEARCFESGHSSSDEPLEEDSRQSSRANTFDQKKSLFGAN